MRVEVVRFAEVVERGIAAHDEDRGPTGWKGASAWALFKRLEEEVAELRRAILHACSPEIITSEAGDVGALAMMIADVVGGLQHEEPS
ncbi:MAG TPA: hypothetical protein VF914_21725 [Chloroflexia bacterium]|jgi:NTP pyrophosphatase (non-canonical NTP hydrolase)